MSIVISGATIIDGVADRPFEGRSIWIEQGRIKAIAKQEEIKPPSGARLVDARGKYLIPGLMNANVHLMGDIRLEILLRHIGRYEEIVTEAAQVALKSGLTTVFDTWGPRRHLMAVRDRINAGRVIGSRVFCAGNIVGFDGPFSSDFDYATKASSAASPEFINRINAVWVENVGRHLMWLTPEQVAAHVRTYIGKGIDFVKYASNEHGASPGCFLTFSPQVQSSIVAEAHRAGLSAQAHTHTVEGLRIAIEAGCDLIQHANATGPVPIPETTLELIAARRTGTVVFPLTLRAQEEVGRHNTEGGRNLYQAGDTNVRSLVRAGASILLANDAVVWSRETLALLAKNLGSLPEEDHLFLMATGHFAWFKAMEEKGMEPMEMLKAATINIAAAYGKAKDLGTIEAGKIADLIVLEKNPLQSAANYRTIQMIFKDGALVDRDALPTEPVMTKPAEAAAEEEASYIPCFANSSTFPVCPMCMSR